MHISHARTALVAACAAFAMACVSAPAMAGLMASNDTYFSYSGTVTGPNGTYTIPGFSDGSGTYTGRDASVFITKNAPTADATAGYENTMMFLTNWYASLDGLNDGNANPNDTDTGFVQLYDTTSAGVASISGGWTNNSYTTFTLAVTGNSGSSTPGYDRLWAAPEVGGASADTGGAFGAYTLLLTATFAPGAVTEESSGWFSTTANPLSVTGSFAGSFTNTGSYAPGAYTFDLTFIPGNWAGANGLDLNDSYFGASAAPVPEPSDLGLFLAGLLGLGGCLWVRRRQQPA